MKLESINYKAVTAKPDFLARIVQISADSDRCFHDMDSLLRSDQGAVSLILRVANSAMYCRGKHIRTIPHAINLLGINVIRSLAILSVSRSIFTQSKNKMIKKHVWQHSLLTALACQQICIEAGEQKISEEAFVAGLLHDIGKALLFFNCPDEYIKILDYALHKPCACAKAERKFLEFDHYDVGRKAISEWKLPAHFGNYVATNLEQLPSDHDKMLYYLAIANNLVKSSGIGGCSFELPERKEQLMNLGASDNLSDYLLEESFMKQLIQNDIYLLCV